MKPARVCLLFLLANLAPATFALPILISETRRVTAGIAPGDWSFPLFPFSNSTSSPGTFGLFSETETISMGSISDFLSVYANATATQVSDIAANGVTFHSTVSAGAKRTFLDTITAGANSTFAVTFQLMDYMTMSVTGQSHSFGALSSDTRLVSASGEVIPLIWTIPHPLGSHLNFSQLLAPGVYTLNSSDAVRITGEVPSSYDSFYKDTTLNVQFSSVPDHGSVAFLFALGLTGLGLARRWIPMRARLE